MSETKCMCGKKTWWGLWPPGSQACVCVCVCVCVKEREREREMGWWRPSHLSVAKFIQLATDLQCLNVGSQGWYSPWTALPSICQLHTSQRHWGEHCSCKCLQGPAKTTPAQLNYQMKRRQKGCLVVSIRESNPCRLLQGGQPSSAR